MNANKMMKNLTMRIKEYGFEAESYDPSISRDGQPIYEKVPDHVLEIAIPDTNQLIKIAAETHQYTYEGYLRDKLYRRMKKMKQLYLTSYDCVLFVAEYIPEHTRDRLIRRKINYADACGNIYLFSDKFFIFVDNKPNVFAQKPRLSLFGHKGLTLAQKLLNLEQESWHLKEVVEMLQTECVKCDEPADKRKGNCRKCKKSASWGGVYNIFKAFEKAGYIKQSKTTKEWTWKDIEGIRMKVEAALDSALDGKAKLSTDVNNP